MENKNSLTNLAILILGGTLLVFPLFGFAYDDKTTHPALTQEIVKFFNKSFPEIKVADGDTGLIIQGSIDEDSGIRWMRHFYDPVYNRGLTLSTKEQELAVISTGLNDQTGKGGSWPSAKTWASDTSLQGGFIDNLTAGIFKNYFSSESDYSWDRAIYEYAWGNKDRGLTGLGHILHLLEDMTVPDHTRNDPHPPILDMGSPYEGWTAKFNRQNLNINPTEKPIILADLSYYFDKVASHSNNNFFSEDSIFVTEFINPLEEFIKIEEIAPGVFVKYGYKRVDGESSRLVLYNPAYDWKDPKDEKKYTTDDEKILTDYWSHLSKQAVLNGAGVVKLFFDEVEKEKQTNILYEKNRSWLGKQIDKFKSSVFNLASVLYGTSVAEKDLGDTEIPAAIQPESELTSIKTSLLPAESLLSPIATAAPQIVTAILSPQTESKNPALTLITKEKVVVPANVTESSNSEGRTSSYSQSLPPDSIPTPIPTPTPAPTPSPSPTPTPTPPPDIIPPDISFNITECDQSLSPAVCLLATTTINITWSATATDLARYNIECELNNSVCSDFNFASTTATSTIYSLTDNSVYTFKARAIDNAGNQSIQQIKTVEISLRPLVINEIGWMGTSATRAQDEWLEIFNPTSRPVNLSDIILISETDGGPNIRLSGTIASKAFYLIERTDDSTISDIIASTTTSFGGGLNNNGEVLALKYGSTTLDRTPLTAPCGGWCGGAGNPQYWSMERYDPLSSGEDQNNWGNWTGFLANGKNADGLEVKGTPGRRNSINYLIDKSANSLNQNKTIKKANSPYLISSPSFVIQNGFILTIEPGTVIKFFPGSSLVANGIIKAEGTSADPIIFTSFKDDSYGGDTNQDDTSTIPQSGDWGSIKLTANGSIFDRTVLRYGGLKDFSANHWANLKVENTSFTLKNSIIEESAVYGLWLTNASGTIEANIIKNNNRGLDGIGLTAQDGSLNIVDNTFTNNTFGLQLISSGAAHSFTVTNNIFSQNSEYPIRVISARPNFSGNAATNNGINGINLQGSTVQDYTLASDLPYVIQTTYYVPAGKTLTILPGTVIKLGGVGGISTSGKFIANGTAANKIIFTSLNDDDCGILGGCGDTNGTTAPPAAGDWYNLSFLAGSASSTLDYVSIRYGGIKPPSWTALGALRIKDSSIDVKNTIIENSYLAGIWLENSTSTSIIGSTIKNHREPPTENAIGLNLVSSSPFIQNTTFDNNKIGILADGSSLVQNGGGNIFTNNTTDTTPAGLIP